MKNPDRTSAFGQIPHWDSLPVPTLPHIDELELNNRDSVEEEELNVPLISHELDFEETDNQPHKLTQWSESRSSFSEIMVTPIRSSEKWCQSHQDSGDSVEEEELHTTSISHKFDFEETDDLPHKLTKWSESRSSFITSDELLRSWLQQLDLM